jgi:ribonuclease HI
MIQIYTDGSCLPNGVGGWGFIIVPSTITNNTEYQVCGSHDNTTNNRMELQAVIEALSFDIPQKADFYKFYTDSKLTMNCAKGEWKRNANLDLWTIYDSVSKGKRIEWEWVKAHNNNYYNEQVDKLANGIANELANELKKTRF